MIILTFVLTIIAGMILTNGVPHFVKGVVGESHQTPFGKPSSAVVNVLWAWINFVVGLIVLHISRWQWYPKTAFIGLAIGSLLMALIAASMWSKHPEHNQIKE